MDWQGLSPPANLDGVALCSAVFFCFDDQNPHLVEALAKRGRVSLVFPPSLKGSAAVDWQGLSPNLDGVALCAQSFFSLGHGQPERSGFHFGGLSSSLGSLAMVAAIVLASSLVMK
jgi:hypothetical protein